VKRVFAAVARGLGIGAFAVLALRCGADPDAIYDDFLERADRRAPDLGDASVQGAFVNLAGNEYMMNIALTPLGDLALRLRVLFTSFEEDPSGTSAAVQGEVRFETETRSDPPITEFSTTLDQNGRMVIASGVVKVPAERSPVAGTAVEAELTFTVYVLDRESLCGFIEDEESRVIDPIKQPLKGTTFGAELIDESGAIPENIPQSCPGPQDGG
jgi:hypothetical protein